MRQRVDYSNLKGAEKPRSSRMYQIFRIPKRRGGFRQIEAPKDELKEQQRASLQVLERILPVSPFAHAFRPFRSIASMAAPHVGKEHILSIDIRQFFPSIKLEAMQKALSRVLPGRARVPKEDRLAMSEKVFQQLGMHFVKFKGEEPRLPQGGPASPLLSNAYLFEADWILAWRGYKLGITYTRYADDLVFSGDDPKKLWQLYYIAGTLLYRRYGLELHPRKIKMQPDYRRQMVCGVVVNKELTLPRRWRRNLRAALHQEGLYQAGLRDIPPKDHGLVLAGKESYLNMIKNPPAHRSNIEMCELHEMMGTL